jgi:hypothetical protein
MAREWIDVKGILRKGYGVASGHSQEYPYGSLERQVPIFRARGLDLAGCFLGTLNIDIRPLALELVKPEFTFRDVSWTNLHPPEHFSFSRCEVSSAGMRYPGWIYYPHQETKRRNFQDASLLEVVAAHIPNLRPGEVLDVYINPERTILKKADSGW